MFLTFLNYGSTRGNFCHGFFRTRGRRFFRRANGFLAINFRHFLCLYLVVSTIKVYCGGLFPSHLRCLFSKNTPDWPVCCFVHQRNNCAIMRQQRIRFTQTANQVVCTSKKELRGITSLVN